MMLLLMKMNLKNELNAIEQVLIIITTPFNEMPASQLLRSSLHYHIIIHPPAGIGSERVARLRT
jgi:hypothetical protein